jgi:hypothetical protein
MGMTKEQWLVYLWSIYPDGGVQIFYFGVLIFVAFIIFMSFVNISVDNGFSLPKEQRKKYVWTQLGWWKISIPSILLVLIFLSNLVPNREYFAYIIATPYVVDSGKSIIETLDDHNSKLSKLNQIMDKGLDKVLLELDKKEK